MKPWLTLALAALSLAACRPADVKVESPRVRVMNGETVTFTKTGFSLCGAGSAWTDMRLGDMDERTRVVLGQQQSVLNPGHAACYRIGDTVALNVLHRQLNSGGMVRINSLSLVLLDHLTSDSLSGRFFASSANFNAYRDALAPRMKPDMQNIVTIVNFSYLPGTAADEASLRQKDAQDNQGDGYAEVTDPGVYLPGSSCKAPYTYIPIPADLESQFKDGTIQSWYTLKDTTCVAVGQEVDLSTAKGAAPSGRVRITKVKRFRVRALDPKFFVTAAGFDFQQVRDHVAKDNSKASEWMVVTDFELIPQAPGGTP